MDKSLRAMARRSGIHMSTTDIWPHGLGVATVVSWRSIANVRCYTRVQHPRGLTIPTRHPRISVTNDPALADAISRVRIWMDGVPDATMVHDLAIRGAEAMAQDEELRREALDRLARWATDPNSSMDRETLLRIDELAWRREQ